jgi:hypothetical protein
MKCYWIRQGHDLVAVFVYTDRSTSLASPVFSVDIPRRDAARVIRDARRSGCQITFS